MTLEEHLDRIASALETIAAELGGLAAEEEAPPAKPDKPAKKPPAKEKQTKVGSDDDEQIDITKEEVRAKLQAVQKATTPAQAKSILKAHGASTIGNLAVSKYPIVIADCDKLLEDA